MKQNVAIVHDPMIAFRGAYFVVDLAGQVRLGHFASYNDAKKYCDEQTFNCVEYRSLGAKDEKSARYHIIKKIHDMRENSTLRTSSFFVEKSVYEKKVKTYGVCSELGIPKDSGIMWPEDYDFSQHTDEELVNIFAYIVRASYKTS